MEHPLDLWEKPRGSQDTPHAVNFKFLLLAGTTKTFTFKRQKRKRRRKTYKNKFQTLETASSTARRLSQEKEKTENYGLNQKILENSFHCQKF